jgi:general secretion pathway protein D
MIEIEGNMKIHSLLFMFLFVTAIAGVAQAQPEQSIRRAAQGKNVNSDELVSFKSDVPYSKALQSLGELSKKLEGKLLIDRSPLQGKEKTIGINIESMYWKDALELILRSNQLWYNDNPEYIEIVSIEDLGKLAGDKTQKESASPGAQTQTTTTGAPASGGSTAPAVVDSSEYYSKLREVTISSVFFDVNKTKLAESGVSFSIFRGKDLNLQMNVSGASKVTKQAFSASVSPSNPNLAVSINAAISMFESEQLGDVIARPQMNVRSGTSQTIQIGQDFSVFEKDFSGNTVQKFYPTGTILTVRPKLYKIGDLEFIDIQYRIEKSTFTSSTVTTVINRNMASGSLTLLNGEEGYIGGMYSNDETFVREGVPLLKDLPWWVFGLRYLFGYDSKQIIKRELIILIKADILPTLEERASKQPAQKNLLKEGQQEMDRDLNRRIGK